MSVGNVSEITVAGLMGVNTVADGERPRPSQQKGVQCRGKSWLLLAALSSSVPRSLHYRACSPHPEIKLLLKTKKLGFRHSGELNASYFREGRDPLLLLKW